MAEDVTQMLKQITDLWLRQIKLADDEKERKFAGAARQVMDYVGKRYSRKNIQYILNGVPRSLDDSPLYLTTMNYTQAFVDIMVPYVFAKVPNRLVLPIVPQLPPELSNKLPAIDAEQSQVRDQDNMLCYLLQRFLNWTPKIYGLKREGRMAVQESQNEVRWESWSTT